MRRNTILVAAASFCAGLLLMLMLYHYGVLEQKKQPAPTKATVSVAKQEMPVCVPQKYAAVTGDSLWKIAEREWGGRAYFWPVLLESNPEITNPNLIFVGQVITIPCLCDLPVLAKKQVTRKVARKATRKVVAPLPCPECPKCSECPKTEAAPPAPEQVAVPEAPAPPAPEPQAVVTPQLTPKPTTAPAPVTQTILPTPQPATPVVDKDLVPPEFQSYHGDRDLSGTNTGVPVAKQNHQGHIRTDVVRREFPGSYWNTILTNPVEERNWIDYFHFDQGVEIARIGKTMVVPYIGINAAADTKGYQWNNRLQGEAGIKLVRFFDSGIVEIGSAYAVERRFGNESPRTKTGIINFAGGWHGWQLPNVQPAPKNFLPGGLPGSFQWRVGNTSPFERNNVIAATRIDQGFTLAKFGRVSLIPTATVQVGVDSDKNPWNRRYMYGGGLKVAVPWKSGIVDVQGGYMCAKQYAGTPLSRFSNCGPAVSLNFWTGWGRR